MDTLREEIANKCHEQWSDWMKYLFNKCYEDEHGDYVIPATYIRHWKRQMETDYADLSEKEQESDRKEADKYIKVFRPPAHEGLEQYYEDDIDEIITEFVSTTLFKPENKLWPTKTVLGCKWKEGIGRCCNDAKTGGGTFPMGSETIIGDPRFDCHLTDQTICDYYEEK